MILDWEKWLPLLRRNVPIALLFFILGCTATYAVVYQLVLESKNAKIEILQTELDHEKIENTKSIEKITTLIDDLEIEKQQKEELVGKLENIHKTSSENDFQHKLKDCENKNEQNIEEIKQLKDTQQMPSNLENDSKTVKNDKLIQKDESNDESQNIEKLLELAEKQIIAQKYTTPQNDNAFKTYQQVLTLVPDNEQAMKGLEIIYTKLNFLTCEKICINRLK